MSRLFAWYNARLVSHPLSTNAISTAALFGIGDIIAQSVTSDTEDKHHQGLDLVRTGRAAAYGGIIFAPIVTRWYPLLNKIQGKTPVLTAIKRMTVDQTVFAPFAGIPLYYLCLGLMEGKRGDELTGHLRKNYWSTLLTNWSVWPAVQFVNFMFVPLQLRLLTVNVVSIAWNTFLSLKNAGSNVAKVAPTNLPPEED